MEQFKKAQVVMLPTEQKFNIGQYTITKYPDNLMNGQLLSGIKKCEGNVKEINQHLYIISDDEIKEGDWFITLNNNVFKCCRITKDNIYFYQNEDGYEYINQKERCKKIIATTDISLELPQLSQQFIERYIECYNKGEIITDVLVEYEDYDWDVLISGKTTIHQKIKVNPKDNTITIKKVKDSYSREEHSLNLMNCVSELAAQFGYTPTSKEMKKWNDATTKWIKDNL